MGAQDPDPRIGELLDQVVVPPGPTFWHDLDRALADESAGRSVSPGAAPVGSAPLGTDPVAAGPLSTGPAGAEDPSRGRGSSHPGRRPASVIDLTDRRRDRRRFLVGVASVAAAVALVGVVAARQVGERAPETIDAAGTDDSADGRQADDTTGTAEGDTVGAAVSVTGRIRPANDADGGLAAVVVESIDGSTLTLPSDHEDDVAGLPLGGPVVDDGAGGLVYGLVDYDDGRSDRSSSILHLPAGAERPVVVVTEPVDGVGSFLAVVDGPQGPTVVYTTLLDTRTRAVPLTGGEPVTISEDEAVAAGGSRVMVATDDACRSFELLDPTGAVAPEPSPRPASSCGDREGIVWELLLSPDGTTLAFLDGTIELHVVVLATGVTEVVHELPVAGHLVAFDGRRVLVEHRNDGPDGPPGLLVVDVSRPTEITVDGPDAWRALTWPTFTIAETARLSVAD